MLAPLKAKSCGKGLIKIQCVLSDSMKCPTSAKRITRDVVSNVLKKKKKGTYSKVPRQTTDPSSVSFHFVSFRFISFRFVSFRPVSFYLYTKVPETRTAYFRVIKPNAVIIVI